MLWREGFGVHDVRRDMHIYKPLKQHKHAGLETQVDAYVNR